MLGAKDTVIKARKTVFVLSFLSTGKDTYQISLQINVKTEAWPWALRASDRQVWPQQLQKAKSLWRWWWQGGKNEEVTWHGVWDDGECSCQRSNVEKGSVAAWRREPMGGLTWPEWEEQGRHLADLPPTGSCWPKSVSVILLRTIGSSRESGMVTRTGLHFKVRILNAVRRQCVGDRDGEIGWRGQVTGGSAETVASLGWRRWWLGLK